MVVGQRKFSLTTPEGIAKFLGVNLDELVYMDGELQQELGTEDKTATEHLQLMRELDEYEYSMIFNIFDSLFSKKKFKDFFNNKVASLLNLFL